MKKLFTFLLVVSMVISLAACDLGNNEGTNPNSSDDPGVLQNTENMNTPGTSEPDNTGNNSIENYGSGSYNRYHNAKHNSYNNRNHHSPRNNNRSEQRGYGRSCQNTAEIHRHRVE